MLLKCHDCRDKNWGVIDRDISVDKMMVTWINSEWPFLFIKSVMTLYKFKGAIFFGLKQTKPDENGKV